jgi:hypothetical protein
LTFIEEKEKILNSSPAEEREHSDDMLTPWEMELNILEDWLEIQSQGMVSGDSHARRNIPA